MEEPANFSIPENNLAEQGPPALTEVDESAQYRRRPRYGPPPLTEVDGCAKFGLLSSGGTSLGNASQKDHKESNVTKLSRLNSSRASLVEEGFGNMSQIKGKFLIGAIAGFFATLCLYRFLRLNMYEGNPMANIIGYLIGFWCFYPGWMFHSCVHDCGLADGPFETFAEYLVVATVYGLITGAVHVVWSGRKPAHKPYYWILETPSRVATSGAILFILILVLTELSKQQPERTEATKSPVNLPASNYSTSSQQSGQTAESLITPPANLSSIDSFIGSNATQSGSDLKANPITGTRDSNVGALDSNIINNSQPGV